MRNSLLNVLTVVATLGGAVAGRALPAQDGAPTNSYAMAVRSYLPLESVRDGTVRMPKALARKVSVSHDRALLQQVLLEIATQAQLGLSYGEDLARSATAVSVDLRGATAAEALAAAVRGTRWAVLVNASGQVAVVPAERRVLATVGGRVTDRATGLPVAGATVTIDGTRLAATADEGGRYRIVNVPPGSYTVSARRIGYARATLPLAVPPEGTLSLDIALDQSASTLDQIVVTGVPTATTKRTLGNSITSVDAEQVTRQTVTTSVAEVLQGRAPGVTVLASSGTPGTAGTIRIRGTGSVAAAADPVVYVDGVRIASGAAGNFRNSWESPAANQVRTGAGQDATLLGTISPEDIESIEVIKGPAAATLYGADAANGVIQIITKRGRPGEQKARWRAKVQSGQTDWGLGRRASYTTCTAERIGATLPDGSPAWPGCAGKSAGTILKSTSLDRSGALRGGNLSSYAASVTGGGRGFSYFTAADYDEEQGVFRNSENSRKGARANFSFYPSDRINYSAQFGYARTETQFPQGDNATNMLESAWTFQPGAALGRGQSEGFAAGSPSQLSAYDNWLRTDRVNVGGTFNVQPLAWFRNRLTVGADLSSGQANRYIAPGSLWAPTEGQMTQGAPRNNVYTLDYAGTLQNELPWENTTSAFSAGVQYVSKQYRNTVAQGTNFPSSTTRDIVLSAQRAAWSEFVDVKTLGFYAQEQVGWRDRLYLTGALRVDNSSVFGENIKQLYYPKLSAAYVLSEEPAMKGRFGWLDQLKLRAAWGQAGNAPDPFAGVLSYTSQPDVDNTTGQPVPMLRLNTKGNPDVKPERGTEIEAGFDAGLLGGRLGAEFTVYSKTTKDALMQVPTAPSEGFPGFVYQNLGEISNRGVELALTATPVSLGAVSWESRVTLSTNRNRLVRFGYDRGPIVFGLTTYNQRYAEGFPLGGFWVHDPVQNSAGDYVPDSARYVGPANPTRELSFGNTFTLFKNLRLYSLIDYRGGFYVLNQTDWRRCAIGTCWEVNDPNRSAESKRLLTLDLTTNDALYTQKGDFIKLRDVSLSYELPAAWFQRVGAERATITLSGRNLAILWKADYKGLDPEVNFAGDNGPTGEWRMSRVDYWTMPMTRRFTASLDLGF